MSDSISRDEIEAMIAGALAEYDDEVGAEWARIRIEPEKWQCSPYADSLEGYWAVTIDGDRVLYFDEAEDGFNWSTIASRGLIEAESANDDHFGTILERIAQAQSERARAKLAEGDLPDGMRGPGSIVRHHSTYWEVRTPTQAAYRVHFRDNIESVFVAESYPGAELASQHPLLVHYDESSRSLYFAGIPIDSRGVAERLDRAIREASQGWRALATYAGSVDSVAKRLQAGHGMLMYAPESVCAAAATVLTGAGVDTSILGHAAARPGLRVLVLGQSYVIAGGFAFEPR